MYKLSELVPPLKDLEELLTDYSRLFQRFLLSGKIIESLSLCPAQINGTVYLTERQPWPIKPHPWHIELTPSQADSYSLLNSGQPRLGHGDGSWVHSNYAQIVDASLILRVREYVGRLQNGEGFDLLLWEKERPQKYKCLGEEELKLDLQIENAVTARTL